MELRGKLSGVLFLLPPVGSGDGTQALRLRGNLLYLMNHLAGPCLFSRQGFSIFPRLGLELKILLPQHPFCVGLQLSPPWLPPFDHHAFLLLFILFHCWLIACLVFGDRIQLVALDKNSQLRGQRKRKTLTLGSNLPFLLTKCQETWTQLIMPRLPAEIICVFQKIFFKLGLLKQQQTLLSQGQHVSNTEFCYFSFPLRSFNLNFIKPPFNFIYKGKFFKRKEISKPGFYLIIKLLFLSFV